MKILLDECLPLDFRHRFPDHEAHTVEWAGLKGQKNGELLRAAEEAGYDAFLTVDQGIPHEQPHLRSLAIVLIRSRSNQLEDLIALADQIRTALDTSFLERLSRCPPQSDPSTAPAWC